MFPVFLLFGQSKNCTISVNISDLKVAKGSMIISLFNQADHFPKEGKEFKKVIVPVNSLNVQYTFKNIPAGEYSIAVLHDKNSDGNCNKNLLGIPKEGYCFSNNIKPIFSAPSFQETKFKVLANQTLNLQLHLVH